MRTNAYESSASSNPATKLKDGFQEVLLPNVAKRDLPISQGDVYDPTRLFNAAVGQSHNDLDDVKTVETKRIFGSARDSEQEIQNAQDLQTSLDRERKRQAEIAQRMAPHRHLTRAMHPEWQKLGEWISILKDDIKMLDRYGQVSCPKTIQGIMNELQEYHRSLSCLVSDHLRQLGGVEGGRAMVKVERDGSTNVSWLKPVEPDSTEDSNLNSMTVESGNLDRVFESLPSGTLFGKSAEVSKLKTEDSSNVSLVNPHQEFSKGPQKQELANSSEYIELDGNLVEKILHGWKKHWVARLSDIFQSIDFPPIKDHIHLQTAREERRATKLWWEKCVFMSVDYMYKFGLIDKGHVKGFFTTEMAQITGRHLADLFRSERMGISDPHNLMPNMLYIKTHWLTGHLHKALSDIEENTQAQVLYSAMEAILKEFHFYTPEGTHMSQRHHFFVDEAFLATLNNWNKDLPILTCQPISRNKLRKEVESLIGLFQNADPFQTQLRSRKHDQIQLEFMFTYYILSFLKTYHPGFIQDILLDQKDGTFEKQMLVIEKGQELHRLMHEWYDYKYFLSDPGNNLYQISEQIGNEKLKQIRTSVEAVSQEYITIMNELEVELNGDNEKLKMWFDWQSPVHYILGRTTFAAHNWEGHLSREYLDAMYSNIWFSPLHRIREPDIYYDGFVTPESKKLRSWLE